MNRSMIWKGYNFSMKIRTIVVAIVLVSLVLAGIIAYAWVNRPELVDVYPVADAADVPVTTQIRLVFSKPMNYASVMSHLQIDPTLEGEYRWDGNILSFTPNQSWPNGKEVLVRLQEGVKAKSWLAFPMQAEIWSFTIREANLVYLWPSDGPADIYSLNPKTGAIHQYTQRMRVLEFTASNDGMNIFFSGGNVQGGSDLYRIDLIEEANSSDNSYQPQKILDCGSAQCRSPAVSFDEMNLAYEYLIPDLKGGLGPAQIWLLSLQDLQVKPIGQATHETVQPAWSSKGWLAFYDRTSQVYEVVNPNLDTRIQLVNQTGQPGNWSPDGELYLAPEIMYYPASGDTETGISHLLQYGIKAGTSGDLSKEDLVEDVEGNYAPDGGSIAFARKYLDMERWSWGRQIWIMNSDGSNPHQITDEPDFNHYDLAWSWDSLMLAYVRFDEMKLYTPPELWMIGVDGSNPIQLVIGGYSPLWIP
jgi:Tol biopolymer transport system component